MEDKRRGFNTSWLIIFLIAIVSAVWLRIYYLKMPGYSFDIGTFLLWTDKVKELGILKLYTANLNPPIDYPPLIPYISKIWVDGMSFFSNNDTYIFKLLPTLAEIVMTILALYVVLKSSAKNKYWFVIFVILQPATAFVTSAWGQVDAILTLLVVISFFTIDISLYLSTIFMVLAILTKPQAAIAVIVYLFWLLFKKGLKKFVIQVLFALLLLGGIFYIFYINGSNLISIFTGSTSRYPYLSMNAYNFWWMIYGQNAIQIKDFLGQGLSAKIQGLALFAAFLAPAIYFIKTKARDVSDLFLVTAYAYLIFFTFPTQMHERYLYPAVALIPFAIKSLNKAFGVYIMLSATLLINCFIVLEANFPQFGIIDMQLVAGDWTRLIGLINVLVAIYLAMRLTIKSFK